MLFIWQLLHTVKRVISFLPHTHQSVVLEQVAFFAAELLLTVTAQYVCWPPQDGTYHVMRHLCFFCCVPWLCFDTGVCITQVMLWSWQLHWLASLRQEGPAWYAPLPLWWSTWGRAPSRVPWQEKQTLSKEPSSECSLPWMLLRLDAVPNAVHAIAASALLYSKFLCSEHAKDTRQVSACIYSA